MANFCFQCSMEIFNEDFGDFKGISTESDDKEKRFVSVLCEGCGPIFVNSKGKRVKSGGER